MTDEEHIWSKTKTTGVETTGTSIDPEQRLCFICLELFLTVVLDLVAFEVVLRGGVPTLPRDSFCFLTILHFFLGG